MSSLPRLNMDTSGFLQPLRQNPKAGMSLVERRELIVTLLVAASLFYQAFLCLINTTAFHVGAALVGLAEFSIYAVVLCMVFKRIPAPLFILAIILLANFFALFLFRGGLDVKGIRDLLIVFVFFWLGHAWGTRAIIDRVIASSLVVIIAFGFFELLALDQYVKFFHTASYLGNQSGIGLEGGQIFEGQALALNGYRPEGIGRTILPGLLGSHRVSATFLEPVSLGNYCAIVIAWLSSYPLREKIRFKFWATLGVFTLIALADSRFGLTVSLLVILSRLLVPLRLFPLFSLVPWVFVALLMTYAASVDFVYSDSFVGRLLTTGNTLISFDVRDFLGAAPFRSGYGDQGYAYLISRFGLIFIILAWVILWLSPVKTRQGLYFRGLSCIYMTLILSISGTSLFALKSAGLLWFILGTMTVSGYQKRLDSSKENFDETKNISCGETVPPLDRRAGRCGPEHRPGPAGNG